MLYIMHIKLTYIMLKSPQCSLLHTYLVKWKLEISHQPSFYKNSHASSLGQMIAHTLYVHLLLVAFGIEFTSFLR